MWRPASSRSRPCLPQRLLFVVLAAAILTFGCNAPAKDKENGTAAGQAAGGDGKLQGKAEQDLLKWALCECMAAINPTPHQPCKRRFGRQCIPSILSSAVPPLRRQPPPNRCPRPSPVFDPCSSLGSGRPASSGSRGAAGS